MAVNSKIDSFIREPLKSKGYDLVKVNVIGGKKTVVDISIDRFDEFPVSMDDCIAASRLISTILDVEDVISSKYNLNVGSPGEYRQIMHLTDYERFCGREISLELFSPLDGRKKISGILLKIEQNSNDAVVYLSEECNTVEAAIGISYGNIKKAKVKRVFKNK